MIDNELLDRIICVNYYDKNKADDATFQFIVRRDYPSLADAIIRRLKETQPVTES